MSAIESSPLGIYVSIPFCRAKCSYCNFASGVFGAEKMATYADRLVEEIHSSRQRVQNWQAHLPSTVDSVYFGGGTPSIFSSNHLEEILNVLHETFSIRKNTEITLECAPGQIPEKLLAALPSLGINRISLGVQSFVDREASAVGRLHTRAIVFEEIARLRHAGIENINLDLIAGLPHQTLESWQTSLEDAVRSSVPHISVYMLDVDEDSRLGREILSTGIRYGAAHIPGETEIAEMYDRACLYFAGEGIVQYEISNFARPGFVSRHNRKYWTRQPYMGFGLDAHSFLSGWDGRGRRVGTAEHLEEYLSGIGRETITEVSPAEALEEAWFLGLRLTEGVSLAEFQAEFGPEALTAYWPVLDIGEREGWIERCGDRVRLTARGRLFSNEVFTRFLGVASPDRESVASPAS